MASAAASLLIEQIHHERQEPGSMLCAQHALNGLLQGNYYDPSQLADLARQLDEIEQTQVADEETWRMRDRESLNMDDTGFFSVSVLEKALEVWGLRLVRWRSEEMRAFQDKPEEQLAFVLNLESHWFTIRGFQGGYWFNLNSFLEKPSWVGPSYLGALLNAAESEGYSVFVAVQADDARNDFHSSVADECAATLPPAAAVMDQEAETTDNLNTAAQGLKPTSASAATAASSSFAAGTNDPFKDEDADLQAALQASLADAEASGNTESAQGSRMHSPTIAGQRRMRSGPSLYGAATGSSGAGPDAQGDEDINDDEETDEQVDAIAPSRRRARGLRNPPYVLPTASGGRRRASRQHSEDGGGEAGASRRRRRQQLQRDSGLSRETAIGIDDTSGEVEEASGSSGLRRGAETIVIGDDGEDSTLEDDDDDDDDFVQMLATSTPRSPFLNPALQHIVGGAGSTNSDDDFHSLSSGGNDDNDGGLLGESWVQGDLDAVRRHAMMQDRRTYDDEDAQLQAALAASMRDAGQTSDQIAQALGNPQSASGRGSGATTSFEDDLAAASWINEEDSRAIREAQASFANMARQVSTRSDDAPPPPADVEKIAKMRAEAKRKLEEEEEAKLRGPVAADLATEAEGSNNRKQGADGQGSDDEEESDSDNEPELSPEEIRRARLARFGA